MAAAMTLVTLLNDGGYSWTLTSYLGDMLTKAEQAYGSRDISYTILGIEFYDSGPQIWFPGNCRHIAIQLTLSTMNDMPLGCYQLAHECIHLLSPTGTRASSTLEEGLATFFAHNYVQDKFNIPISAGDPRYESARVLVSQLLSIDENAVKTLRDIEPTISNITASQILSCYPSFDSRTAEALVAPFVNMP